jgi:hypothetical protein
VQLVAGLASGSAFPIGVTTQKFVVTDGTGATDTCSFNVTVNHTVGIQNSGRDYLFTVLPVPATDHITVTYQNSAAPSLHVKLTSVTGQWIFDDVITPFDGSYAKNLDLKEQAAGTYILEITSDNETVTSQQSGIHLKAGPIGPAFFCQQAGPYNKRIRHEPFYRCPANYIWGASKAAVKLLTRSLPLALIMGKGHTRTNRGKSP